MHKIDELPEETTITSTQINRSLTDIRQSLQEPTFLSTKKTNIDKSCSDPSTNDDSSEPDDEQDMETLTLALESVLIDDENETENDNKIKNQPSEPVIQIDQPKASVIKDDEYNDDDDIWCNQEDEDNLEYRVKIDEEKEKQLRGILGEETLRIVREALQVGKT